MDDEERKCSFWQLRVSGCMTTALQRSFGQFAHLVFEHLPWN